tara:strand:- start:3763 stop:4032 length:270 start_codon:yes stop_codon:yes gene_type:complete
MPLFCPNKLCIAICFCIFKDADATVGDDLLACIFDMLLTVLKEGVLIVGIFDLVPPPNLFLTTDVATLPKTLLASGATKANAIIISPIN